MEIEIIELKSLHQGQDEKEPLVLVSSAFGSFPSLFKFLLVLALVPF